MSRVRVLLKLDSFKMYLLASPVSTCICSVPCKGTVRSLFLAPRVGPAQASWGGIADRTCLPLIDSQCRLAVVEKALCQPALGLIKF